MYPTEAVFSCIFLRQAKTLISLGIHPVWSMSSLDVQRVGNDFEDPDQTGRKPRLIWIRWPHMSICWFCRVPAYMSLSLFAESLIEIYYSYIALFGQNKDHFKITIFRTLCTKLSSTWVLADKIISSSTKTCGCMSQEGSTDILFEP